jgi:hypothetical protein
MDRTQQSERLLASTVLVKVFWVQETGGLASDEVETDSDKASYQATEIFSEAQIQQIANCLLPEEVPDHIQVYHSHFYTIADANERITEVEIVLEDGRSVVVSEEDMRFPIPCDMARTQQECSALSFRRHRLTDRPRI